LAGPSFVTAARQLRESIRSETSLEFVEEVNSSLPHLTRGEIENLSVHNITNSTKIPIKSGTSNLIFFYCLDFDWLKLRVFKKSTINSLIFPLLSVHSIVKCWGQLKVNNSKSVNKILLFSILEM
jgi:hypothetical protein